MKSIRAFIALLAQAPRNRLLLLVGLMLLSGLTEGVGLLLLVPLLDMLNGVTSSNALVQRLLAATSFIGIPASPGGLLGAFFGLVTLRSGILYARESLGATLQHRLVDQLRLRSFAALLSAEWRWLVITRRADHANLLLTDVSRVGVGLNFGLSLLAALLTMSAYLVAAFTLSWSMTGLALLSGAVVFGALSGQRRAALSLGQDLGSANRALHSNVQESLTGIKLAKILGTENRHLEQFTRTTGNLRARQLRFSNSSSLSRALFQIGGAGLLAAYLYVGLRVWHTPIPELLTLVLIFSRLIPLFMSGQQQLHYWLHALPALDEINRLLEASRMMAEPVGTGIRKRWPVKDAICLNGVRFTYEGRDQVALNGVSVTFPANTTTAIMGSSGAGKSTLADILIGLLEPDAGELTVDGMPIRSSRRRDWRQQVAYVPQDVLLFNDSIRNNLLWGKSEATEVELRRSIQRAAADFVFQLPKGLDTVVGDGGIRLSGGERQRLALARALLGCPSLLILDEATSALDLVNEARVREAIEQLHGDLTVVIIGHRLPTLEHADQVIVLEAGKVAAQGSWDTIREFLKT